jgi:hypothetical protein
MQQVDMDLFGLSPEFADTYKYMASMGICIQGKCSMKSSEVRISMTF